MQSWPLVHLLIVFLWCGLAVADSLSELPGPWQDRIEALPDADISGAEPAVRKAMADARVSVNALLTTVDVEASALAGRFGELGNLYQIYDVHTLAETAYANARTLDPGNFRWAYYAAYLAFSDGRIDQAIPRFQEAARLDPGYAPIQLRLGQCWYEQNRLEQAIPVLEAAARVPELKGGALYLLGQIDLLERRYDQAIGRFERVLATDPEADQVHYPLARAYRAAGNAQLAREHLALQGRRAPRVEDPLVMELEALKKGARPLYVRALQEVKTGYFVSAVSSFKEGLERDPDNLNARISLARAQYLAGQGDAARIMLEEVLARDPNQLLAAFLLGVLKDVAGDGGGAADRYRSILELDPAHAGAHYFLANRLLRERDYPGASRHYASTLASESENPPARLYYLIASLHAGEPETEIAAQLSAEVQSHPEQQMASYAYSRLLAGSAAPEVRDPGEALVLARELAMSLPIPPHLEALAYAEAASGNFAEALDIQKQLMTMAWIAPVSIQQGLQEVVEDYEQERLPSEFWPPDDPLLTPPPVDARMVFREYPSPVPF